MTDLIPSISQLGFPIAITTFLIYDYAKKLSSIQIELVKMNNALNDQDKTNTIILTKLDALEKRLYDK